MQDEGFGGMIDRHLHTIVGLCSTGCHAFNHVGDLGALEQARHTAFASPC